jgi:hypothetical protein
MAFVLGVLCSIPLDWYARRVVELSLNFFHLNSFPIPALEATSRLRREIELTSGRLAVTNSRLQEWGRKVGGEHGPLSDQEKDRLIARLDALVAMAYGLDREDLIHIFETFHEGWDYQERLDRTLAEFEAL